jgi:hypothetical protein
MGQSHPIATTLSRRADALDADRPSRQMAARTSRPAGAIFAPVRRVNADGHRDHKASRAEARRRRRSEVHESGKSSIQPRP